MSDEPELRDLRKHSRTCGELPVLIVDTANRVSGEINFDSADFSAGGAFLRSDLLFEAGEVLELEFQLPSGRLIRTGGRVARVSRESGSGRIPGMGVEFVNLDQQDRAAIEEYLRG